MSRASSIAALCLFAFACQSSSDDSRVRRTTTKLLVTRTVDAHGDTYVRSGSPNQNQGSDPIIRLQSSGKNRGLLFFDKAAIQSAVGTDTLRSATLEISIDVTGNNWGPTGRPIAIHRLLHASSEYASTWNCATDSSIYNSQANCSAADGTAWSMDAADPASRPWQGTASATTTIVDNQTGAVGFDVTQDIAAILAGTWQGHGFLLKKVNESENGQIDFASRERAPAPRLILSIDAVPPSMDAGTMDSGVDGGVRTRRFITTRDAYLREGQPNQNFGSESILRIQASGRNRAVLGFDIQQAISAADGEHVGAARIELAISQTYNNWGSDRSIGAHRLRHAWTEYGSTWNCAHDPDVTNSIESDCVEPWVMWAPNLPQEQVAWIDPPSDVVLISNEQTGTISFDVSREIACAIAGYGTFNGFIIKKEAESQSGQVEFHSRETGAPPALVVEYVSGSAGLRVTESQCLGTPAPDAGTPDAGGCQPSGPDTDCDGTDDDCDQSTDEDYVASQTSCGVGACASIGETSCVDGHGEDTCTPGIPASTDTTCNAIDDDCDGTSDENYAGSTTSCGVGACAATGTMACTDGNVHDTCVAGTPGTTDVTCDGVDDDCDGQADEAFAPQSTSCGVGACAATGTTTCEQGVHADTCVAGPPTNDANCDGVDNDCDGAVDDKLGFSCALCQPVVVAASQGVDGEVSFPIATTLALPQVVPAVSGSAIGTLVVSRTGGTCSYLGDGSSLYSFAACTDGLQAGDTFATELLNLRLEGTSSSAIAARMSLETCGGAYGLPAKILTPPDLEYGMNSELGSKPASSTSS
jgi:hypothetical protein